jgi:sulfite reductase alpha subunit-like flavoprotein
VKFNYRFSIFALGNSSYPKFCAFGLLLDSLLNSLGAERVFNVGLGDELCGQEASFNSWVSGVFKVRIQNL